MRLALTLLPLIVGGCARGPSSGDLAGWNVLLITIDTLRADRVGWAGDTSVRTPILDGLAQDGVVFDTVIAAAPVTLPSHATILTGLYPPAHGALDNGLYSLPDDVPTLATVLRDAGWETGAVIGAYVLHGEYGLARGFDHYDDRFRLPRGLEGAHRERRAAVVVDRALEWMAARDDRAPFFLWTHFYDPHAPYDPPGEFRLRFATSPYDGEVAYTDQQIGRLLDALRARGELERTLVVVTSDHGEAFGDGGETTHGLLLREATLRIPMVITAPGVIPGGRRVTGVVSNADVTPTVLELLGLEITGELDGRSLVSAIRSGRSTGRVAYSETRLPRDQFGWADLASARDDRWARVVAPIPELYDLVADPAQATNLDGDDPGVESRLDAFVSDVRSRARDVKPQALEGEEAEALRALGYVISDTGPEFTGLDPKEGMPIWRELDELRRAMLRGEHEPVIRGADDVLSRDPGNGLALRLRGEARVARGDWEAGLADLRAAFQATGFIGVDGSLLARSLMESGRTAEAQSLLERFIAAQPGYAEHYFNLGILLSKDGRPEEARAAYESARSRNPAAIHVLANLSLVLADLGDSSAVDRIAEAIALSSDDRPALLRIDVLRRLGRPDAALEAAGELQRKPRLNGVARSELADELRKLSGDR